MSDYGRYSDQTRNRDREQQRDWNRDSERGGFSRNSDSIFGFDRDRDMNRNRGEERSRWTNERENFGSNRDRERMRRGRDDRDGQRERSGRQGEHYGRDDYREGLPIDETNRLIGSNKVEGTAVYGSDDERLGSIYNFMVDKRSGRVEYAVMSYGGFLGMGTRYYPLPWQTLTYDTDRGGYRVQMRERDLQDAPSFDRNSEPRFDRQYGERVHSWYGLNY